jgi:WD40 repeat protein
MKTNMSYLIGIIFMIAFGNMSFCQPEVTVELGHKGPINAIALSCDMRYIATGGQDQNIKIWDFENGNLLRNLKWFENPLKSVVFSEDGKYLFAKDKMDNVAIFDLHKFKFVLKEGGENLKKIDTTLLSEPGQYFRMIDEKKIEWVTYSKCFNMPIEEKTKPTPKGSRLVLIGGHWDHENHMELSPLRSWAFSKDSKFMVTGGTYDSYIYKYALETTARNINYKKDSVIAANVIGKLCGLQNDFYSIALSPNRQQIAIAFFNNISADLNAEKHDQTIYQPYKNEKIDFNTHIALWDLSKGIVSNWFLKFDNKPIHYLYYTNNGLHCSSTTGSINLKKNKAISGSIFFGKDLEIFDKHIVSPNGRIANICGPKIYFTGSNDFDTKNLTTPLFCAFHPNSDIAVTSYKDKYFAVFDFKNNKILKKHRCSKNSYEIFDAAFSDDGKYLAVMTDNLYIYNYPDVDFLFQFNIKAFPGVIDRSVPIPNSARYNKKPRFSPDNKYVGVITGKDVLFLNEIPIINLITGKIEFTYTCSNSAIASFSFYNDSVLAVATDKAELKLVNFKNNKELLTFYLLGNKDFACITPELYYLASPGAFKYIFISQGLHKYDYRNLDIVYNRPDIILDRLGIMDKKTVGLYGLAYKKRLSKMGFNKEIKPGEIEIPTIEVMEKNLPMVQKQSSAYFKVKVSDSKYPLDRLNVFVNNVPIYGLKGIPLTGNEIQKDINIDLSAGKNTIEISAHNSQGLESLREHFEYEYKPPIIVKPDLYIITIGVNKYADQDFNLEYAAKDARDIASIFSINPHGIFGTVHQILLTDEQVTRENILNIKKQLSKTSVDDNVILFAAGHGLLDNNFDFYYATHDIDFNNPSIRGIRYDELEDLIDGIPARKKMFVIDACHSGEVEKDEIVLADATTTQVKARAIRGFKKTEGLEFSYNQINDLMNQLFEDLRKGTGSSVLTSSGGAEFSFESDEYQNGVFTYCLLKGLKNLEADKNNDKMVQISELKDFVIREVTRLTNNQQNPTSRIMNVECDFRVW